MALNINLGIFDFNTSDFGINIGYVPSVDKDRIKREIESSYKLHAYTITSAVKKAASNQYEYEILASLVNSIVNEFIYGLVDEYAKKGYLNYISKVSKHVRELEKRIKGELKQVAKSMAGMNYHIVKGH